VCFCHVAPSTPYCRGNIYKESGENGEGEEQSRAEQRRVELILFELSLCYLAVLAELFVKKISGSACVAKSGLAFVGEKGFEH
jgi:hypothetical protein